MKTLAILSLVFLAGCAGYRPIVDMQGQDANLYERDLAACQTYATQVSPGERAAVGAGAGAVFGAALGAIFGNRQAVGQLAAAGALYGATGGGAHGADAQINVIRNCLQGRGWRVLQ